MCNDQLNEEDLCSIPCSVHASLARNIAHADSNHIQLANSEGWSASIITSLTVQEVRRHFMPRGMCGLQQSLYVFRLTSQELVLATACSAVQQALH